MILLWMMRAFLRDRGRETAPTLSRELCVWAGGVCAGCGVCVRGFGSARTNREHCVGFNVKKKHFVVL